jgi:hypothetical protein
VAFLGLSGVAAPNKHINLTRWHAEIDSSGVARRLCAGRWAEQVEAFPVLD